MARRTKTAGSSSRTATEAVTSIKYSATRKNIPLAGLESHGRVREAPPLHYHYNPHLPPVLRSAPDAAATDRLAELLAEARRRALSEDEAKVLEEALKRHEPWLEWSGKRERPWFEVDPVALHMHERVATQADSAGACARGRTAGPVRRSSTGLREGGAVLPARRGLGQPHDSRRFAPGHGEPRPAGGSGRQGSDDLHRSALWDQVCFQLSAPTRPARRKGSGSRTSHANRRWSRRIGTPGLLGVFIRILLICVIGWRWRANFFSDTGSIFVQIGDENLHRIRGVC